MKKTFSICIVGLTAASLLSGCQPRDDDTKKQLAALQEQLAKQQEKEAERIAREKEQKQEQERQEWEKEIYRQAEEDLKHKQFIEEERKAEEQKALKQKAHSQKNEQTPNQATASSNKKFSEKLARYPAFVITESGNGTLNLRGAPATSAVSVTQLRDGSPVQVIAITNVCPATGCWVKVQANGVTGYVNEGYLQKGIAPRYDYTDDHGEI